MRIEFVTHASFIVEHAGKRLICDPWLEGAVFNDGWRLIAPTRFGYDDFRTIDYIWFSHEHPDHFYPPNVRQIPEAHRAKIAVLFQETKDKRVVNFCRQQRFKDVVELKRNQWLTLADDFRVHCEHFAEGDSWICFKGDGLTYLNTNDCGIRNRAAAQRIKARVGKVDVLLTQFSYAYWAGNPDQREYRQAVAQDKLRWLKFQCDIFQPAVVIPIASFIYFCHQENRYLNDSINTPRATHDFIRRETDAVPVILYNGETYRAGAAHDSERSIALYEQDWQRVMREGPYLASPPTTLEEVLACGSAFVRQLDEANTWYLKRFLKPANIHLLDLGVSVALSPRGIEPSSVSYDGCDAAMSSDSLLMCFKTPYGLDTTQINGRLRKPPKGTYHRCYRYFRINHLKSRGEDPNSLGYLAQSAWRNLLNRLGLYTY